MECLPSMFDPIKKGSNLGLSITKEGGSGGRRKRAKSRKKDKL